MLSNEQIALNVMSLYIQRITEQFPKPTYLSEKYLHVLKIREWQLRRRKMKRPQSIDDLPTLRHGHHTAECLYLDIDRGSSRELVAEIQNILQLVALEFHAEIVDIEAQHPEHRARFARDKEEIRLRWNHYVEEAEAWPRE